MMRTSLMLPPTLYQRLVLLSKQKSKTWSQVVRELLDKALVVEEDTHIQKMYDDLSKLEGIVKENMTDASTTIDEVLYGENGAWRGKSD